MVKDRFRAARKLGYRSGLEVAVARQLTEAGVPFEYEPFKINYTKPQTEAKYTPDQVLANGIIIETKGMFNSEDRKKHKLIHDQHPLLDLRFVFSNPNGKIGKKSRTTYAMWCEANGFKYAAKLVPQAWCDEPVNPKALAAIQRARKT